MKQKHLKEKNGTKIKDSILAKKIRRVATIRNLSEGDTIEIGDLYLEKSFNDIINSIEDNTANQTGKIHKRIKKGVKHVGNKKTRSKLQYARK